MSARIPALIEDAIVEHLRRGDTFAAVARCFKMTYKAVTKVARRNGIKARAPGRPHGAKDARPRKARRASAQTHPSQQPKRPPACGKPTLASPTRDLARGRTRWRCPDCGVLAAGTTCPHGHVAPWAPSLDPLEVSHG